MDALRRYVLLLFYRWPINFDTDALIRCELLLSLWDLKAVPDERKTEFNSGNYSKWVRIWPKTFVGVVDHNAGTKWLKNIRTSCKNHYKQAIRPKIVDSAAVPQAIEVTPMSYFLKVWVDLGISQFNVARHTSLPRRRTHPELPNRAALYKNMAKLLTHPSTNGLTQKP